VPELVGNDDRVDEIVGIADLDGVDTEDADPDGEDVIETDGVSVVVTLADPVRVEV
jgi:hypothetical protein